MALTAAAPPEPGPAPSARRPGRDPLVDLIRAAGIAAVLLLHWLMPVLAYGDGVLRFGNALSGPGGWAVTWVAQVMPLVFFAGGAANAMSWAVHLRRGGGAAGWLSGRLLRLAGPVLPLAAVWTVLPHLLLALGVPEQPVQLGARIAGQLLWFLAVYVIAVASAPLLLRLPARWDGALLTGLAGCALAVDAARFAGVPLVGYLNVVFVWVFVHQLGTLYARGRLGGLAGRRAAAVSAAAFALLAAVALPDGLYPASMIGMPGAPVSNMSPPTFCLILLACAHVAAVLALRPVLVRAAARPLVAGPVRFLSERMMTVYLWHMPALCAVSAVAVVGLGAPTPAPGGALWWLGLPLWLAALGCVLAGLVRVFARFERTAVRPGRSAPAAAAGLVLVGAGLLGLTAYGFVPADSLPGLLVSGPVPAVAAIAAGLALAGRGGTQSSHFPISRSSTYRSSMTNSRTSSPSRR
ncbi:acyltransferase family protein [Allonocardiopsis opalescens]|uniref:Acyltransferase 3 domain-containing protein n=1 Tax=Allonocardiopsis opalescens TaxID=1144618 RepID=A0A2T0Q7L3_9ACTN|nr:acyltransferase [Allonocardiopsis opalescens]PRX99781.1 hypothetical protein CLV72_103387 [Allonocardiopsis opalescens]